jgi:hypothetical protein
MFASAFAFLPKKAAATPKSGLPEAASSPAKESFIAKVIADTTSNITGDSLDALAGLSNDSTAEGSAAAVGPSSMFASALAFLPKIAYVTPKCAPPEAASSPAMKESSSHLYSTIEKAFDLDVAPTSEK